jgi:hypothetical protein
MNAPAEKAGAFFIQKKVMQPIDFSDKRLYLCIIINQQIN